MRASRLISAGPILGVSQVIAAILPEHRTRRRSVRGTGRARLQGSYGGEIALAPLANEALIKHQLRALKQACIAEVIIPCGSPDIRNYFQSHHDEGVGISFGGPIPPRTMVVLAADTLPGRELRPFAEYHARSEAPVTVAVGGALRRPSGIYAVSPEAAAHLEAWLLSGGAAAWGDAETQTFALGDDTVRIETVEDYLAATRVVLAQLGDGPPLLRHIDRGVWSDGPVFISPGARITGNVLLGRSSSVAPGATVAGPTVLGEGTMVCRNARVESSVIWAGAAVGSSATIVDSLLTECFAVAPGAVFDHCVGIDRDSAATLPFGTASHGVEYSPRGLAVNHLQAAAMHDS